MPLNLADFQSELEKSRRRALVIPLIALLGTLAFSAYHLGVDRVLRLDLPILTWLIVFLAVVSSLAVAAGDYSVKCSKLLMPAILASVSDRIGESYQHDYDARNVNLYDLEESGLVSLGSEQSFSHRVDADMPDGNALTMFNFNSYTVTYDKDGKKQLHPLDSGVFVERRMPRQSDVRIVVRDKVWFSKKQMSIHGTLLDRMDKVNGLFDKHYLAYTNDPIKALRFLSPSMIEKFITMAKEHGHVSEISVSDDRVFVFLNGATIRAVDWLPFRKPNVEKMIEEGRQNILELLDVVDLICNQQRLNRMDA